MQTTSTIDDKGPVMRNVIEVDATVQTRTSAGTVMTSFGPLTYTKPTLEGSNI